MADDGGQHPRLGLAPVLGTLLLIAAYPLSLGPMIWLVDAGYVDTDNRFWTAFYAPLFWTIDAIPASEAWLAAYLELWGWSP
jgi:hypothetical protein